jgi:YD repeat-containing protein
MPDSATTNQPAEQPPTPLGPTANGDAGTPLLIPAPKPQSGWTACGIIFFTIVMLYAGVKLPSGQNLIIVTAAMLLILFIMGQSILQQPLGILINNQNVMSLARLQMAVWTVVVGASYFTYAISRAKMGIADPMNVTIDWHLLALMGISTGSLVGSALINSQKQNTEPGKDVVKMTAELTGENEDRVEDNRQGLLTNDGYFSPGVYLNYINNVGMTLDPVNTATGELYDDELDLELPGPLPLQLRRNYSSQNTGVNLFGTGWKLNFMPYLYRSQRSAGDPAGELLYAALPDGTVLAYYAANTTTGPWVVMAQDNPQLNNYNGGAIGSINNYFNSNIARSGSSGNYTYTLHLPDGGNVTYNEMHFPVAGNATLTRDRPYLTKWQDSKGNYLTFQYDNTTTDPSYGQLLKIQSTNGNFLAFQYNQSQFVSEVDTRDGRRVQYDYNQTTNDLIDVIRADNSEVYYAYLDQTDSGGNVTSTHLLSEIDEPEGRRLLNSYDSNRRVTSQSALAGPNGELAQTASYAYATTGNISNTTVTDALGKNTVYSYYTPPGGGNSTAALLLGQVTDPLGRSITYSWFLSNTTVFNGTTLSLNTITPSAVWYQRSLMTMTDQRGLVTNYAYNTTTGNPTQKTLTGNLDGDATGNETATYNYIYNSNNLITQELGPSFNIFTTYGGNGTSFLPIQITTNATGSNATVSVENFVYGNTTGSDPVGSGTIGTLGNISLSAYGLLCGQYVGDGASGGSVTAWAYDGHGYPIQEVRYQSLMTLAGTISGNASAVPTSPGPNDYNCTFINGVIPLA